jgi:hypothetical protein
MVAGVNCLSSLVMGVDGESGTSFFQFFKRLFATVDKSSLAITRRKLLTVFPIPVF